MWTSKSSVIFFPPENILLWGINCKCVYKLNLQLKKTNMFDTNPNKKKCMKGIKTNIKQSKKQNHSSHGNK